MDTHGKHGHADEWHAGHRKKKRSALGALRKQAQTSFLPNTYSRRMTRYSAYDFDSVKVRGEGKLDKDKLRVQEMEDSENLFLESLLTKIHDITSSFILVNTAHQDLPIVYVSDEFLSFWGYTKKEIFRHDGRLPMMVGPSTAASFNSDIEEAMLTPYVRFNKEYNLYKKGHKKTLETYVSVLGLPVHSKAKYVLLSTEMQLGLDNFGVETKKEKESFFSKIMSCGFGKSSQVTANVEEEFTPDLIKNAVVITREFEKSKENNFLLLHDSLGKVIWDWIILYVVIWTIFIVPYQLAFKEKLFSWQNWVSVVAEVLFMFEVLITCLTTFINDEGIVISELKSIWHNYWSSGWLFVDLIAAIPWELIFVIFGIDDDAAGVELRVIALLRILKVLRHMAFYTNSGFASMVVMMMVFSVFAHWFACGWALIGDAGIKFHDGWLYQFVNTDKWSPFTPYEVSSTTGAHEAGTGLEGTALYISCLYFTFTSLSTTGFGNTSPVTALEKIYSVIIMVVGAVMYATIFGNVANIIQRLNQQDSELVRRETELVDFMHVNKFPESLRNRMEDYFYNYWYTTRGVEAHEIMENWPKALREDAYHYIHDLIFTRWPVLNCASTGFKRALSGKLQRIIQCPGDTIYHSGDCVGELYFVIRGHIKVIKEDRLIGILTSGDVFGEEFWPTRTARKSKANVQALTYCEFEVLTHESLNEILIQYPDYWDLWKERLKITYELSAKGDLFAEMPEDLVDYVKTERTEYNVPEEDAIKDPKQYYKDLMAQKQEEGMMPQSAPRE